MTVFLSKRGLKKILTFFIECKIPVEGNLKKTYLYMSTLNQWSPFADDFQIDLICLFANCIFQTWAFCKFTNERMNVVNERGERVRVASQSILELELPQSADELVFIYLIFQTNNDTFFRARLTMMNIKSLNYTWSASFVWIHPHCVINVKEDHSIMKRLDYEWKSAQV